MKADGTACATLSEKYYEGAEDKNTILAGCQNPKLKEVKIYHVMTNEDIVWSRLKDKTKQEVDLGGMELTELPAVVHNLKEFRNLRKLILRNNNIVELPDLGGLLNLESLDIRGIPVGFEQSLQALITM